MRVILSLIMLFTFAASNLHPASMIHVEEDHAEAHIVEAAADHDGHVSADVTDLDHGVTPSSDHHAPPALAVRDAGLSFGALAAAAQHRLADGVRMTSRSIAPPTEPPSA